MSIYLDTHVVVWLYAGDIERLSPRSRELISGDDEILVSPIVALELEYLHEIDRISDSPRTVLPDLLSRVGLEVCRRPFGEVIECARACSWTRDPFDRIIVGQAAAADSVLLTKDETILANYAKAKW